MPTELEAVRHRHKGRTLPRHTKLPNGRIRIRRDWLDARLADLEVTI